MDILLTALLCVLALLLYFSDRSNQANKWCSAASIVFCLGVLKEVFLYNFSPWLLSVAPSLVSQSILYQIYSVMTWMLYSFAMPLSVVFSMHSCNIPKRHPRFFKWFCPVMLLPILVFSFLFSPLTFHDYQISSLLFWQCFSIYNLLFGSVFAFFLIRGVYKEEDKQAKKQKKMVAMVFMPPIIYWLITIFIIHPLGLSYYFKLWRGNTIIVTICIALYIWIAFRDGMMGLRLKGETYNWNSDMSIINKGAEFTGHMMKNQATKMEWCIQNLQAQYRESECEPPEELAILERSILNINNYIEKKKQYSGRIVLLDEICSLHELIPQGSYGAQIRLKASGSLLCDRAHTTEVFENIVRNGIEASEDDLDIVVMDGYDQDYYLLHFIDQGCGMDGETLKRVFTPYFTTKNAEKNFGLGLVYCQNVMKQHGGMIRIESQSGKGTTVTLCFPKNRKSEVVATDE